MAKKKRSASVSAIQREIAEYEKTHGKMKKAKAAIGERRGVKTRIKVLKHARRLLIDFFGDGN